MAFAITAEGVGSRAINVFSKFLSIFEPIVRGHNTDNFDWDQL